MCGGLENAKEWMFQHSCDAAFKPLDEPGHQSSADPNLHSPHPKDARGLQGRPRDTYKPQRMQTAKEKTQREQKAAARRKQEALAARKELKKKQARALKKERKALKTSQKKGRGTSENKNRRTGPTGPKANSEQEKD